MSGSELAGDLSRIESRIDELTLAAFDLYVACREKIAEIRVREARSESDRLARVVQALTKGDGSERTDGHPFAAANWDDRPPRRTRTRDDRS